MIPRYKGKFKHDWEEPYLENSRKGMFKNTFADIEYILTTCAEEQHALRDRVLRHRPSLYAQALPRPRRGEAAAVRAVRVRHSRRHRPAPGRRHHDAAHRRPPVRRTSITGRCSAPARTRCASPRRPPRWAATCASAWRIRSGSAPASSPSRMPQQVTSVRQILEGLGLEIATPDDAREILSLKGGDKVNF